MFNNHKVYGRLQYWTLLGLRQGFHFDAPRWRKYNILHTANNQPRSAWVKSQEEMNRERSYFEIPLRLEKESNWEGTGPGAWTVWPTYRFITGWTPAWINAVPIFYTLYFSISRAWIKCLWLWLRVWLWLSPLTKTKTLKDRIHCGDTATPEVSNSRHLKAHNLCAKGIFFLPLLFCNFDDQLSSNFHRFVILCICWDTPSDNLTIWQFTTGVQCL